MFTEQRQVAGRLQISRLIRAWVGERLASVSGGRRLASQVQVSTSAGVSIPLG